MKINDSDLHDIIEKNYDDVLNFCKYKIGNAEDALDLTQTVFVIFIEGHTNIELESAARWLLNTASHKVSDYHRANYNKRKQTADVEPYDDLFVDSDDYFSILNSRNFEQNMDAVFARLSELDGELCIDIRRRNENKTSYEEMALKYGCSEQTIRKRSSRLVFKVRSILKELLYIFIVLMEY